MNERTNERNGDNTFSVDWLTGVFTGIGNFICVRTQNKLKQRPNSSVNDDCCVIVAKRDRVSAHTRERKQEIDEQKFYIEI